MRTSILTQIVLAGVIGTCSARITSIAAFPDNFVLQATESSTLPVTFVTENGQSPVLDWFITLGVSPIALKAGDAAETALGTFVDNVDLFRSGFSNTGTGNFTVDVPVNTTTAITRGAGKYVVTAALLSSSGVSLWTQPKYFNLTFRASTNV